MAWDTKYRPVRYRDVVGQDSHVAILKSFVREGAGFQQSYVFCGPFGSGKTTLGRILARALLCEAPQEGEPCDQCGSCRQILHNNSSDAYFEVDAATNSGKDDIKRILESLQYASFSGKRKIYLFDEAHQLSRSALDALLKVMEDTIPGTDDKWLICIFCTTEPHNMRDTIFSRCAPAFVIRKVSPREMARRLAWICDQEGVEYDLDALELVAAIRECHFRDAIKAVETVSKLGPVDMDHVGRVLNLGVYEAYADILVNIGKDEAACQVALDRLLDVHAPSQVYQELTALFMLAYRASLGVAQVPVYMDAEKVLGAGREHGSHLVVFSGYLSSRPYRVSEATLRCDLSWIHHMRAGSASALVSVQGQGVRASPVVEQSSKNGKVSNKPQARKIQGVYVDSRAVNRGSGSPAQAGEFPGEVVGRSVLSPNDFRSLLESTLDRLHGQGQEGRPDLGGS